MARRSGKQYRDHVNNGSERPIAVVTGANRGIGREVCVQLVEQGFHVFLTARDISKAEAAADEIGSINVAPLQLDVSSQASINAFAASLSGRLDHLDLLINNAAIHYDTWESVLDADPETITQAHQTNVLGPWMLAQRLLPLLRASERARIVNVSSGLGSLSDLTGHAPAYAMSKASLNALTLMLARALSREGILVNAVCPGWVRTDMGGAGGRPIADGARGIVWAATLPIDGPTGGFFRDRRRIDW